MSEIEDVLREADEWLNNHRKTETWQTVSRLRDTLVRLADKSYEVDKSYEGKAWQIIRFNLNLNDPDWEPAGNVFRSKDAAEEFAEKLNTQSLRMINVGRQTHHQKRVIQYEEAAILTKLGFRNSAGQNPGEFVPQTELGPWDERYIVEELEFED